MSVCKFCQTKFKRTKGHGVHVFCTPKCKQAEGRRRRRKYLRDYSRNWYKAHREESRRYHRAYLSKPGAKRKRAISARERVYGKGATVHLERQIKKQKMKCAVCHKCIPKPNLDHNHITGQLRGAVCHGCNTGIGHIEKPGFVKQALAYLKKWEGTCSIQKQD